MRFSAASVLSLVLLLDTASTAVNGQIQILRYITTTDVSGILALANDAADMKETDTDKLTIYENGRHAKDGGPDDAPMSLASLSLEASTRMAKNPYYNIYRHGFLVLGDVDEGEADGNFDGAPASDYGDTIVHDLFDLDVPNIETDAALVMNVWMAAVHELFVVSRECKANNVDRALAALDRSVAFWVGADEVEGSTDDGHLLYNLAQKVGAKFGQTGANGETKVNSDLITLYNTVQATIAGGDFCGNLSSHLTLRIEVRKMVAIMTVPLAQNMIFHLHNIVNEPNSDAIELYALALLPPIATCDPDAYRAELDRTVLKATTVEDRDEAIKTLQGAFSCLGITCEDVGSYSSGAVPQCADPSVTSLGGYESSRPGGMLQSYIDRDILQIGVFIKFGDMGNAADWYEYGWNSASASLQDLALNEMVPETVTGLYRTYATYYGSSTFAHDTIIKMLERSGANFVDASSNQLRLLVTGMLQYVVMFTASISLIEASIAQCNNDNLAQALEYWDTAAAYYIGSIEGPTVLGSSEDAGILLFGAAKDFCDEFGTCIAPVVAGSSATAKANADVIGAFKEGATQIGSEQCDVAQQALETIFLRYMPVPLFQGMLRHASINDKLTDAQSDSGSLGLGFAFAQSVLPLLDQADPTSAFVVARNMNFVRSNPMQDGFAVVSNAVKSFLAADNLPITTLCSDIGDLQTEAVDGDMCDPVEATVVTDAPVAAPIAITGAPAPEPTFAPVGDVHPVPTTTEDIAFGRYTFTDLVAAEGDAAFALDVKAMFEAGDKDAAIDVYKNGVPTNGATLSGQIGVKTLASLSTTSAQYMSKDPMFNIFRFALYEDEDLSDLDGDDFLYANDVVEEALDDAQDEKLAAEAAVVMNVWMVIANRLYSAVRLCDDENDPRGLIDSAVALWIGKEQAEGKYDHGWMMYSVAQSAAKYFGLPEQEAPVNTRLMTMFNEAQAIAATCPTDSETAYGTLRAKTDEIIRQLSIPLVQSLLFHMVEDNRNMVELYSVSVVPQCVACDPVANDELVDITYNKYDPDTSLTIAVKDNLGAFLRCLRITCTDLRVTNDAVPGLDDLIQDICKRLNTAEPAALAGYLPTTNVIEESRIDLDILQIKIFMRTKAYDAAYDMYKLGKNSRQPDGSLLSLKQLATSSDRGLVSLFESFKTYLGTEDFADEQIEAALEQYDDYKDAGRGQLQQAVERTLQTSVMYLVVFWNLQKSLNSCRSSDMDKAANFWDAAVAFYVGSIEGPISGGKTDGDGEMLFSLANELCGHFDDCASDDGSELNQDLIGYFTEGRDAIANSQCEKLERTMTWDVLPTVTLPLIQGTLYYAVVNSGPAIAGGEESIAAGSAIAYAAGPLVNAANQTSGETIKRNFDFTTSPVPDGPEKVFEAMTYALRGIGLDCEDVGQLKDRPDLSPCTVAVDTDNDGFVDATEAPIAPHQDTDTNLGDGLYVTTTYVQDRANIALDVKGMEAGLNQKEIPLVRVIYESGENSEVYDANGQFESLRSLQKMSIDPSLDLSIIPLFNVFMYALQDQDGNFMGREAKFYADSLVEETLTQAEANSATTQLPAEAALVLNLWMFLVHQLENTLELCEDKKIRGSDGISLIDVAVAYWIGDGQIAGDGERGHLLYALTEEMGEMFDTEEGGQARANTNILKLFNEAKNELSLPNACSDNPSTYTQLRALVYDITSQMAVPLIQGLIDSLRNNDRNRVKIYAHAVVPMVAQCDPVTFLFLKEKLMNMQYNVVEVDAIIQRLRGAYTCLGLECFDIGVHQTEKADLEGATGLNCEDPSVKSRMATYTPTTDVREYASLDLDMLQLDILLQMKAYRAAKEIYKFGKNVRQASAAGGSLSLFHLATTSERSIVPEFDAFKRYFTEDSYANTIIMAAFDATDATMSDTERRLTILRVSQVMIMYFAVLQSINEAVDECEAVVSTRSVESVDTPGVNEAWDRAAAMMIGSLEGTGASGTENGYMFYNMAQEHCQEFGTCTGEDQNAKANEEMITLLFAGRGAVISNNCDALRKTAKELSTLVLVPIIQATLSTSLKLSRDYASGPRVEGEIYAKALLPLVENVNRDAAQTLENNLIPPGPSKSNKIASETFSAFAKVYSDLDVDCNMVGDAGGYDSCSGVGEDSSGFNTVIIILIVVAVIAILVIAFCVFRRCRRKEVKKTLPENNPTFVTADGELNHSMDLLTKAFSSNSRLPSKREDMQGLNDASPTLDDDFEEESPALGRNGSGTDII